MDDAQRAVLEFAAAHRFVLASQALALPRLDASDVPSLLDDLIDTGWLARLRVIGFTAAGYVITRAGLATVGSALPAPDGELRDLRRAVAAAGVWVRSGDGRFGEGVEVRSARELIAHDAALGEDAPAGTGGSRPFGVRVGGVVSDNALGLHYPDVLLTRGRGWTAVHVQLESIRSAWLSSLLTAYGADQRFGRVVFLVEEERVGVEIESAAVSVGVQTMTSVQWVRWS